VRPPGADGARVQGSTQKSKAIKFQIAACLLMGTVPEALGVQPDVRIVMSSTCTAAGR
jgi:hypothetical protein